jgi:hypothetical protein
LPIEKLLSGDERRQLEATRLIALARDLLTDEREQPIQAKLDHVLRELGRLREDLRPLTGIGWPDDGADSKRA